VKRSVVVEAAGGPLGAAIAGANVHDTKLLAATLGAIVVTRPQPTEERPQHLCLDKGYDNPTGHETVAIDVGTREHRTPYLRMGRISAHAE
jgi:putative transposase